MRWTLSWYIIYFLVTWPGCNRPGWKLHHSSGRWRWRIEGWLIRKCIVQPTAGSTWNQCNFLWVVRNYLLPLERLRSISINSKYMGAGCGVQCGKECALCCRHGEPRPKVISYIIVNGQVITSRWISFISSWSMGVQHKLNYLYIGALHNFHQSDISATAKSFELLLFG